MQLKSVAAFGCEIDVFGPGEQRIFFVFAKNATRVFGDDLNAFESGTFAAGVASDVAYLGPVGAAGSALVAVEQEPYGPLPCVVVEAHFFDVALGKSACGLVSVG